MAIHDGELRRLSCWCPADLRTALERQAEREMISLSDHMRRVLVRSLRDDGLIPSADHATREVA